MVNVIRRTWRAARAAILIIDVIGRAAIEAVLDISAADVVSAESQQRGEGAEGIAGAAYHGRQRGRVYLADRAVRVEKLPAAQPRATRASTMARSRRTERCPMQAATSGLGDP